MSLNVLSWFWVTFFNNWLRFICFLNNNFVLSNLWYILSFSFFIPKSLFFHKWRKRFNLFFLRISLNNFRFRSFQQTSLWCLITKFSFLFLIFISVLINHTFICLSQYTVIYKTFINKLLNFRNNFFRFVFLNFNLFLYIS